MRFSLVFFCAVLGAAVLFSGCESTAPAAPDSQQDKPAKRGDFHRRHHLTHHYF